MRIELTGASGSGKTYLADCFRQDLDHKFLVYDDDLVVSRHGVSWSGGIIRKIIADVILLLYALSDFSKNSKLVFFSIKMIRGNDETIFIKLNIIRNTILKLGRLAFIRKELHDYIVLWDEGLSHLFFNLIDYHDNREPPVATIYSVIKPFISDAVVVLIDPKNVDIVDRLSSRGHRRLRSALYDVAAFVASNNRVQLAMQKTLGDKADNFYVFTPGNDSCDAFVHFITHLPV